MTQTQREQVKSAEAAEAPLTLPYRGEPTGDVVASDAALLALKKTRPWALLFAIALFVYGVVGGLMGTIWMVVMILKRAQPAFPVWQFIVISTGNLLFAPIALVGGVLALRYTAAAGRAYNGRSSEDLERALNRQKHVWLWAAATVIAVLGFPVLVLFVAACMDLWP
jgi:hypothetical protein